MNENRQTIAEKYRWDLSAIYADESAWEDALKRAGSAVGELTQIAGTLGASKAALKAGLDKLFAASEAVERVCAYAGLKAAEDNGDTAAQDMDARATRLAVDFSTNIAFLNPEILAIPQDELEKWLQDADMAPYRHMIADICRNRAHTLSEAEERLLASLGDAAQTPQSAFSMFESVDMRFEDVKDEDGNSQPLTHALFGVYRESRKPELRREAFEKYFGEFKKYIHLLSALYAGSVKQDSALARAHGFGGGLEAALFGDNVPEALYRSLIECVHEGVPLLSRYGEIRRRLLGLDGLSMFDLYVPLVNEAEAQYSFEELRDMVLSALEPLGEEYQNLLRRAFDERWIDVYENPGKTTGAFSCGVYGAHPYVLLNCTNTLNDAYTLAHELGHSLHSWYSDHAQSYVNHNYSIFVAEVASTVNEVLLTEYLLKKLTDKKNRAVILNRLMEGFRTTLFRQTLFAEFELRSHELYERGATLTADALNEQMRSLNETYYPNLQNDAVNDVEWARIPHFYNAFYVYQYATGFSSAVSIADRILNGGGAPDYLRFLMTGGSDYPIEELKIAGVDLTTPEPIRRALRVFGETMDEFEKLL